MTLRPYDPTLTAAEGTLTTRHEKIFISTPENVDDEKLMEAIKRLERYSRNGNRTEIIRILKDIVPTYTPGEWQGRESCRGAEEQRSKGA